MIWGKCVYKCYLYLNGTIRSSTNFLNTVELWYYKCNEIYSPGPEENRGKCNEIYSPGPEENRGKCNEIYSPDVEAVFANYTAFVM